MKKLLILFTTIILVTLKSTFATTTNRFMFINANVAEEGPFFSLYEGVSTNTIVNSVSPTGKNVSKVLTSDSLLYDNNASTSTLRYYLFIGSNYKNDKALDIYISCEGFTSPSTSTIVPIIAEITTPTNNSFKKTVKNYVLTANQTEVISDYIINSGYFLNPYTSFSNYPIPNPDTYNASRLTSNIHKDKELFFMELSIGWNGNRKLAAGVYSTTIKISYSIN